MDDRPLWEQQLDGAAGDVDSHGDIIVRAVPASMRELLDSLRSRRSEPGSAADRHLQETGHTLRRGCCAA